MDQLFKDIRHGFRSLLRTPGFTLIAVLTLALGIGANTAIFSVVNAVLLRPLPFPETERIVKLGSGSAIRPERGVFSFPDYKDLQAQTQTLESVAGYLSSGSVLSTEVGDAERVLGADVSSEYFQVLGVKPLLGRTFTAEEDHPHASVVVISQGLWQRRFGGSPQVIGASLKLGASTMTVIGVMPAGFEFPVRADGQDYWEPLNDRPTADREQRDARTLEVIGRMRPGVRVAQANAELQAISSRLSQQYPASNTSLVMGAALLKADLVSDVRPALLILLGAVGFVLLIACANVANLNLARAAARQKEIAIRSAVGAGRWRIIRQLLIESVMLSLCGGAVGLLLARWCVELLTRLGPANIPRLQQVSLDWMVLLFTLALSAVVGIGFGLAPAFSASRPDLTDALKNASRGSTENIAHNRARSVLVIAEVALSLMLLIGAGLLLKSFVRLWQTNPGFDATSVVALDIPLSRQRYDTPAKQIAFFQKLTERARALPGAASVGVVDVLPMGSIENVGAFNIAGRPPFPAGAMPEANYTAVDAGYFATLHIPLLQGRMIGAEDRENSTPVVLISESIAREHFAGENPLGQHLIFDPKRPLEIVGVVGDVRRAALDVAPVPEIYVSFEQTPSRRMNLVVRTNSVKPEGMAGTLEATLKELDRDQVIWRTRVLDQLVAASVANRRFNMLLLSMFAGLALLLAALGIYGVMAYSVTRRTHELGIRMALGAQVLDVLRLVVKDGMTLAVIGVTIGIAGSLALTRVLSALLFGVTPTDVTTFAGISVSLLLVALLACYIPARRATKVDPLVALRYE
ncbi:MAG TPA: ABC transporter permease [Pyrinomonadaceae bacterium]|nr:ABC transporter permease [Pyrinomonadaceae bacterium]